MSVYDNRFDERETAMVLTEREWRMLADICEHYLAQDEIGVRTSAPEHCKVADRIIEADCTHRLAVEWVAAHPVSGDQQ